jgi:hypothetical protein
MTDTLVFEILKMCLGQKAVVDIYTPSDMFIDAHLVKLSDEYVVFTSTELDFQPEDLLASVGCSGNLKESLPKGDSKIKQFCWKISDINGVSHTLATFPSDTDN